MINPNMLVLQHAARGGGRGGSHFAGWQISSHGAHLYGHGASHVGTQHGNGIIHSLANTFAHSAVSALAWRSVSALFRFGHGIGVILAVIVAVAVIVHFARRRRRAG